MINLSFLQNGEIKRLKKSTIIKNVAYITQEIAGQLVTIQLCPPRNMKITNKAGSYKPDSDTESKEGKK